MVKPYELSTKEKLRTDDAQGTLEEILARVNKEVKHFMADYHQIN